MKPAFDEELVGFDDCDEVELLSDLSLVQRSWTLVSQKALGRIVHFHEHIGDLDYLSGITYNNVFAPGLPSALWCSCGLIDTVLHTPIEWIETASALKLCIAFFFAFPTSSESIFKVIPRSKKHGQISQSGR